MRALMMTKKQQGWWWQPWANTIAYYKLKNDVLDYSWNWNDLTNYNITFGTTYWPQCAIFNWYNSYAALGDHFSLTEYTVLAWYYHSSWDGMICSQWAAPSLYPAIWLWYNSSKYLVGWAWWYAVASNTNTNTWKRVLWVITFKNDVVKLYENAVNTATWTWATPWTSWEGFYLWIWRTGNNYWNGAMSTFIIEDKERTSQEISDYYDQTKADYWIS